MPKLTLAQYKKNIALLGENELRAELIRIFLSVKEVPEFYSIGMQTPEEAAKVVKGLKDKLYRQFWTPSGNPRNTINNALIRKDILAFEKSGASPSDLLDVILYRVELTTKYASDYGGTTDSNYTAALNAFDKALQLAHEHHLMTGDTKDRCMTILETNNSDYWYVQWLKDAYDKLFKN